MPGTWQDIQRALGWKNVSPHSAKHCIIGGAFYMKQMRKSWSSPRPAIDRHNLALASYNAGLGNILKAQKACGGKSSYDGIIACLPRITGTTFSSETIGYVYRIRKWRVQMSPPGWGLTFGLWHH